MIDNNNNNNNNNMPGFVLCGVLAPLPFVRTTERFACLLTQACRSHRAHVQTGSDRVRKALGLVCPEGALVRLPPRAWPLTCANTGPVLFSQADACS